MNGTTTTRVARVVGDLLTHPTYLFRYLRQGLLSKKGPLEWELPWMSFAAIDFLKQHVQPEMTVFEYGSGGSTLFFAQRVQEVVTTEDHPEWLTKVEQRLAERGLRNVTLQRHPYDFRQFEGFTTSAYLNSIPQQKFDVLVIDGMDKGNKFRPVCFQHAEKFVKLGGIIVVDDAWRYPQLRTMANCERVEEFRSVGPCRPGLTMTDVYFY